MSVYGMHSVCDNHGVSSNLLLYRIKQGEKRTPFKYKKMIKFIEELEKEEQTMTRDEILKALDCCINEQHQNCCNCGKWHEEWNCMRDLMRNALTLIKELATENEMLKLKADKWFYQLKDVLEERRKEQNNERE